MFAVTTILRWTDNSIGLTGWGWFVLILFLLLGGAASARG